jgi:hypothetical protein
MIEHYFVLHAAEMLKEAEERKIPSAQKVVAQGLLGLGSGMLAGYGIGRGIQHFAPGGTAVNIAPQIAGTAGAIMGVTYPWWKTEEREAIKRALEARRERLNRERSKAK